MAAASASSRARGQPRALTDHQRSLRARRDERTERAQARQADSAAVCHQHAEKDDRCQPASRAKKVTAVAHPKRRQHEELPGLQGVVASRRTLGRLLGGSVEVAELIVETVFEGGIHCGGVSACTFALRDHWRGQSR